jgi:hypothetical protein
MVIGTALGWGNWPTVALAVGLAFVFGYAFTVGPVLRSGLTFGAAVKVALAADTVSIVVMEIVDNAVVLGGPGSDGGRRHQHPLLGIAGRVARRRFVVTLPVNRALMSRGRGHAVVHSMH